MLDRKILERLFRQNYSGMIRLASVLLRDDSEAEDVVLDVFERLTRIESPASITTGYLMTAVHHGCMNVIRKKKLHEQVSSFYPVELEDETYLAVRGWSDWPRFSTASTRWKNHAIPFSVCVLTMN